MIEPIAREEQYLSNIVGWSDTSPEPLTREEIFYAEILGKASKILEPITRVEHYLTKIAGRDIEMPYPETRLEYFLAKAAGMDVVTPVPLTKEEIFWANYKGREQIIEGVPPLTFKSNGANLSNYRIYGNTVNGESAGDKTNNLLSVLPGGRTNKGITYENKNNLYMQIAGKSTDVYSQTNEKIFFLQAGTYYIRFFCDTAYKQNLFVLLRHSNNKDIVNEFGNGTKFTLENDENIKIIVGVIQSNVEINTDIYVQIAKDIKPSTFEPYGYRVPVTVEGKNLLPITAKTQTISGVTFTVNNDGSVTCNGTATATIAKHLLAKPYIFNNVILTGCPIGGGRDTFQLDIIQDSSPYNVISQDIGDGARVDTGNGEASCRIRIVSGYTCDNLTFYPMIRRAEIADETYEPYQTPVTTNLYLPEQIKKVGDEAEYIDYGEQKQHRVRKNLLRNTASTKETQGYSFVVDNDGTITIDGYFTNTYEFAINGTWNSTEEIIKQGNYTLSNVGDSITSNIRVIAYNLKENKGFLNENTSSALITNSAVTYVAIQIPSGTHINNLKLKIMICKAEITDDTYEPYIENTELDVALPALPTIAGTNILSVDTEVQPSKVYVEGQIKIV